MENGMPKIKKATKKKKKTKTEECDGDEEENEDKEEVKACRREIIAYYTRGTFNPALVSGSK